MRVVPLPEAAGVGEQAYLLVAQKGRGLPNHGHAGFERVLVLEGAFVDGAVRYGVGDISEREGDGLHAPVAGDARCVCLVATEQPLAMSGPARVMQRFLGV